MSIENALTQAREAERLLRAAMHDYSAVHGRRPLVHDRTAINLGAALNHAEIAVHKLTKETTHD